jgi:Carboxypeptidase regulatory-like domain
MKRRVFAIAVGAVLLGLYGSTVSLAQEQPARLPDTPRPQRSTIVGTVVDVNNDTVPGATVALEGAVLKRPRTVMSNANGFFEFDNLDPGAYQVTISAQGFANWTSPNLTLTPGQYAILRGSQLHIAQALTEITVAAAPVSPEEIAAEQVKVEEQQRVFGIFPNFYVSYDRNAVPLTAKLKFQMATKVALDPVTLIGVGVLAGINQAGDVPNYGQGAKGYAERYGASFTDGFSDIMIGGAVLPSLLHQDPRYFYQGTGTTKSRAMHALLSPFICRGDNGQRQPNYSTLGGDLASAAISDAYYPASNRGPGLVFGNFLINTGERALSNVAQEFILRRLTSKAKN